jgi:hypothetical protein
MTEFLRKWFGKDNWKHTCRGLALTVCSILYIFCDDHTDKILTGVMAILALDSFTKQK